MLGSWWLIDLLEELRSWVNFALSMIWLMLVEIEISLWCWKCEFIIMKPYSVSTFDCSMPECRYFCHYQLYFDIHQHFLSDTVCQRTLRCSLTAASAICYPGSIINNDLNLVLYSWPPATVHTPRLVLDEIKQALGQTTPDHQSWDCSWFFWEIFLLSRNV